MRYLISELVIECDFPLPGAHPAKASDSPDLVLTNGNVRVIPCQIPDGELLQAVHTPNGPLYSTVRKPDGLVLLRSHGRAEFEISPDARSVRAVADPSTDLELLGLLAAGQLVAVVLALRGETVLHASAVELGGRAIAFVAHSGTGKSTLAALACSRGARFVTDDVLRFRQDAETVECLSGTTENRLRRDVAELIPDGTSHPTRLSVDGRHVWQPTVSVPRRCRLSAVVLPSPLRGGNRLELCRIAPGSAVLELTRRPRILGWVDERVRAQMFRNLSTLAATVPVYRALVPWGPPFDPAITDELLSLTGVAGTAAQLAQPDNACRVNSSR